MLLVAFYHHRHGVPANVASDAAFNLQVARVSRFLGGRDGVDVGRIQCSRNWRAVRTEPVAQALEEIRRPLGAFGLEHVLEGIQPLAGFFRVGIRLLSRGVVVAHAASVFLSILPSDTSRVKRISDGMPARFSADLVDRNHASPLPGSATCSVLETL